MRTPSFVLALATAFLAHAVLAAPGDFVPSYGTNGIAPFTAHPADDIYKSSVLQADGSVVSVGATNRGNLRIDLVVMRHLADGTPDPTFGSNGRVVVPTPAGYTLGIDGDYYVFVQPTSGKLVVSGMCASESCLSRFLPTGAIDPSFGSSGWLKPVFGKGPTAMRPDGRLLLATTVANGVSVIQLTADGASDTSFGNNGGAVAGEPAPERIFVRGDGKIVLIGSGSYGALFVARRLATGFADTTFGPDGSGVAPVHLASPASPPTRGAVQADGKVLAGRCSLSTPSGMQIARIDEVGDPDLLFGTNGIAQVPGGCGAGSDFALDSAGALLVALVGNVAPAPNSQSASYAVQVRRVSSAGIADGTYGVAGVGQIPFGAGYAAGFGPSVAARPSGALVVGFGARGEFGLAAFSPTGTPDAFGTGGYVLTDSRGGHGGDIVAAKRMGDGRIVVLVRVPSPGGQETTIALARLMPDGTADPAFSPAPFPDPGDHRLTPVATALDIQADGKILVAGSTGDGTQTSTSGNPRPTVWRFNVDGSVDATFGANGISVIEPIAHPYGSITAIVALADGRIALTGYEPSSAAETYVARLTSSGALDATFTGGGSRSVPIGAQQTLLEALVVQPDGKWLTGGFARNGQDKFVAAARTSADGAFDSGFGTNGRSLYSNTLGAQSTRRILLRPDGRSVHVVMSYANLASTCRDSQVNYPQLTPTASSIVLVGVDAQGQIDASFGISGIAEARFTGRDAIVSGAALDSAGRIVVAGRLRTNIQGCLYSAFVARFTPSGALDTAFANAGVLMLSFPPDAINFSSNPNHTTPLEVIVLPDDSIVGFSNQAVAEAPFVSFKLEGGGPAPLPPGPPGDLDNDGVPDSVESSVSLDPLAKDNDIFAATPQNQRLFAMQQYRDFLGREGDEGGIAFWRDRMTSAVTRGQVIESFFSSAEFQGTIAPVARLYFAYFLRIPDYSGLNFWIGYYRAGNTLDAISNQFVQSGEFQGTYGALDNGQFVDLVYQNVLGRAPDAQGRAFWKNELDTGARTRGQVMLQFSESAEYRGTSGAEVYVTMAYIGMLRRAPDAGGFNFWVQQIDNGGSGLALINGFLGSPEYRGRFLP